MDSAPPTPSQDAREVERNSSISGERATSQDAHKHEWIEVGGSGPYCRLCGQWPSQDAEGDRALKAWVRDKYALDSWRDPSDLRSPMVRDDFERFARGYRAAERLIRADYEELVKAARMALECADSPEERVSPKRIDEMTPDEVAIAYCASEAWGRVNAIRDWLRIPLAALESLGGRS